MGRYLLKTTLLMLLFTCSWSAWADEAYWIDVRTAQEYDAGHVEQAVNIPYEEITERISAVTSDKDALIYLYCRSGRRSGIAKEALDQAGFTNVINVGGFEDAKRKAAATSAR